MYAVAASSQHGEAGLLQPGWKRRELSTALRIRRHSRGSMHDGGSQRRGSTGLQRCWALEGDHGSNTSKINSESLMLQSRGLPGCRNNDRYSASSERREGARSLSRKEGLVGLYVNEVRTRRWRCAVGQECRVGASQGPGERHGGPEAPSRCRLFAVGCK